MSFELDHVFVAASADAPEIQLLRTAGFVEGPAHDHVGQGTASRGIFFENAYLEFIWLTDAQTAMTPPVLRTGLGLRADPEHPASPFGFGLRSDVAAVPRAPFESWDYSPAYLPEGYAFAMAANSEKLDEPLIFVLPWSRTAAWEVPAHPNGARRLTDASFGPGAEDPSQVLSDFLGLGLVSQEGGTVPLMRIRLDDRKQGEELDLRPSLPLILCW
jgi:hypothetical protein